MRSKKRLLIAVLCLAIAGTITGVALAVWTVQGSGTGAGAATVAQSLTITAFTPTGAAASLYPGGPAGAVDFQVANPNPFAVTITGVTWGTPTSTNTTACPNSNISLDANAPTTVSISVPPNAPAGTVYSVPGVLDLAHAAPNGCQGVVFDIPISSVIATQQ